MSPLQEIPTVAEWRAAFNTSLQERPVSRLPVSKMPKNLQLCQCPPCVRDRAAKRGEKPPKADKDFKGCDCKKCVRKRYHALRYRAKKTGYVRKLPAVPKSWNFDTPTGPSKVDVLRYPFVKGKFYEWDRTKPEDYGMGSVTE